MANPVQALQDTYSFNIYVAKALLPLTPFKERILAQEWLVKLSSMNESSNIEELAVRNNYLWFLLMVMQKRGKFIAPFDNKPPTGPLPPLAHFVPSSAMEEVLESVERNAFWVHSRNDNIAESVDSLDVACFLGQIRPQQFLKAMPMPANGVFAYGAVFCDEL